MTLLQIIVLSIVQAVTEFLPISSSAHLILMHQVFSPGSGGWGDNLVIDLATHVGTLLAVLVYYRSDILNMIRSFIDLIPGRARISADPSYNPEGRRQALMILAGSLPILAAGFALEMLQPAWARSVHVIAFTTIVFGALLWWVDARNPSTKTVRDMGFKHAIMIGFAQMLALIPGTSRSGITMTAARFYGITRPEAARFSFMLSIVATTAASALGALKLMDGSNPDLLYDCVIAVAVTFVAALGVIAWLMRFLERATFRAFGLYRIFLGLGLLALIYSGAIA